MMDKMKTPYFKNEYIDYVVNENIHFLGEVKPVSNPYTQAIGDYPVNEIPQFICENELEQLKLCTSSIPKLLLKLIKYKIDKSDTSFFKMIDFGESCIRKSINKQIIENLCFRADLILAYSGFKVVELNVATNLGGWDARFHEEAFLKTVSIQKFLKDKNYLIERTDPLVNCVKMLSSSVKYLETYSKDATSTIVIVSPNYDEDTANFIVSILNEISSAQNSNLEFIFVYSVNEIKHVNNKAYVGESVVHGIIFPTRTWEKGNRGFTEEVKNLWWSNKIILPENPVSVTIGDKRLLSLLWQDRHKVGFSADERNIIEKYLPVSFPLINCDIGLTELINNKNKYVIKPGIGLQGKDVLVGKYTSKSQWNDYLSREYGKDEFLIQHYEESVPIGANYSGELCCFKGVWGAFSFGLEYSGVWIRMCIEDASFNGVINTALGASESIVFEIKPVENTKLSFDE